MQKRLTGILIGYFLLAVLLAGCGSSRQQSMKPAADWSRGVELSESASGTLGMITSHNGERIHLVWPIEEETRVRLHYFQMGSNLELLADQDLAITPGRLRTPRLAPASGDELHLLFASRPAGGEPWQLLYARLDAAGNILGDVTSLSLPGVDVEDFSLMADGAGGLVVAWDTRGREGIFLTHLSPTGEFLRDPFELAPDGDNPALRMDLASNLHITWAGDNQVMYASGPLSGLDALSPQPVADFRVNIGDSLDGPEMGLTGEWVYIFWSILRQSGLEAGTARTEYVAFPIGQPRAANPQTISILAEESPAYQNYPASQSSLELTELVPAPPASDRSDFIYQPATPSQPVETMAVALVVNQSYRANTSDQISVAVFEDGEYLGYTNAAKTTRISSDPILEIDGSGSFHLIWREGYAGSEIYYASTSTQAREVLDRLTSGDVANLVLTGGMEGLTSVLFFPVFGFGWILPGFLIIGLYKLIQDDEDLRRPLSWFFLLLAIAIFEFVKFLSLPSIFLYVPFSAWLEVPQAWQEPLRFSVPWLIFGAGLLAAELVRRRRGPSTLLFYIVFAGVDGALTLAIYGVSLMGVG